jgi:hypothetical protein
MHVVQMNLGKSTAAPYKDHALSIPADWHTLAADITTAARAVDASLSDLRLQPVNVCVVNHYTSSSKLGWHQGAYNIMLPGIHILIAHSDIIILLAIKLMINT